MIVNGPLPAEELAAFQTAANLPTLVEARAHLQQFADSVFELMLLSQSTRGRLLVTLKGVLVATFYQRDTEPQTDPAAVGGGNFGKVLEGHESWKTGETML